MHSIMSLPLEVHVSPPCADFLTLEGEDGHCIDEAPHTLNILYHGQFYHMIGNKIGVWKFIFKLFFFGNPFHFFSFFFTFPNDKFSEGNIHTEMNRDNCIDLIHFILYSPSEPLLFMDGLWSRLPTLLNGALLLLTNSPRMLVSSLCVIVILCPTLQHHWLFLKAIYSLLRKKTIASHQR